MTQRRKQEEAQLTMTKFVVIGGGIAGTVTRMPRPMPRPMPRRCTTHMPCYTGPLLLRRRLLSARCALALSISGVSCAQTLAELVLDGTDAPAPTPTPTTVTLVTASATVKAPRTVKQLARTLVTFDVLEENADTLARDGIQLVHGAVGAIDTAMQEVSRATPPRTARSRRTH